MKKVLFLLLSTIAFTACSESKNTEGKFPIRNLELPTSTNGELFEAGSEIIIKGIGFDELSQIWFRPIPAARLEQESKQAEVLSVNNKEIKIKSPEVYSSQEVSLKQSDIIYTLGTMEFAVRPQPKPIKEFNLNLPKNDKFSASFVYDDNNLLQSISCSYPFFNSSKVLDITLTYTEGEITRVITKEGKRIMSDANITYTSKTEVLVNNKESKAYTYTLDNTGRFISRKDSRGDSKIEVAYDEQGNMIQYIQTYDRQKPETTTFTYNQKNSIFAMLNAPSWLWNYILTDIYVSDIFLESLISTNNAITVNNKEINYEYNKEKQPISIQKEGIKASTITYN